MSKGCPECGERPLPPMGNGLPGLPVHKHGCSGLAYKEDPVNHPSHYTQYPVEVIEITERLSFLMGNVVKYVLRADHKGEPIQDLEKALWYLKREIANRKSA